MATFRDAPLTQGLSLRMWNDTQFTYLNIWHVPPSMMMAWLPQGPWCRKPGEGLALAVLYDHLCSGL